MLSIFREGITLYYRLPEDAFVLSPSLKMLNIRRNM